MLGVVITLFISAINISRDTHGQIRSVFGEVLFKTKYGSKNVRRQRKPSVKRNDFEHSRPEVTGAVEYKKLAAEVVTTC